MKTIIKLFTALLILLISFNNSFAQNAQLLLEENFNYTAGDSLGQAAPYENGWIPNSGGAINPIYVTSPGLVYSGYPSSGIGNAISLKNTGQDKLKAFSSDSVKTGSVYASFLVKVDSASAGDYFLALLQSGSGTVYEGRVMARSINGTGNISFGITKGNSSSDTTVAGIWTPHSYSKGVTYLLVLKYTFVPSGSTNDQVSLYVLQSGLPVTEPVTPAIGPLTYASGDATAIGRIGIRQGTNPRAPTVNIDGIRVTTTWESVIGSPQNINDIKPTSIIEPIYIDYPSFQPITPKASFTNIGTANQTNIPVTFIINPGGYSSTKTIPAMSSGTSVQVTFDNFNPTIGISYNITVYSKLASDQNRNNDTIRNSFFMNFPTSQYGCDNGGFEDGGFTYWRGATGRNQSGISYLLNDWPIFTPTSLPYGGYNGPLTNAINLETAPGTDFLIPAISTTHLNINHAVRIGNKIDDKGMDLLAKTFTVDASTSNFTFWYAVILQDGGHDTNSQAFFIVRVRNSAGNIVSNLGLKIVADNNNPYFEKVTLPYPIGALCYKNWDCANIDLSSLAGQKVTVEFIAGDCMGGAHWGYAYIDDICLGCNGGPTGDCSLNAISSSCDNFPFHICGNITLPQPPSPETATCASIDLKIYQNGIQVGTTTITNPASNNFCFTLNASDFPAVPPDGFDFVASANFVISNGFQITKSSGIPGNGVIPGMNNDYSVICPDPNGGCGKGSSFPGPDTCYYCFANSIAPSPLYPSRPSYSWESDPSCKMKLIENGVNQAGTKLVKAPDDPTGLDDGYFKVSLKELQLLCNTDTTKKINFCGVCYDSLFVGTNGVIGFTQNSDNPNLRWWEFPTSWNSHNFENGNYLRPGIHPFWNDLYFNHPDSSGGTNGIYCSIKNNQLLITYSRASVFNKSEYVSFQVCYELTNCLSGNGNIKFTYSSAVNGRTSPGFITKYHNSSATSGPILPNLGPYLVGIAPKNIFGQNYILYRKTDVFGMMGNWETFNEPRINRPLYSATNSGLSVEFGPNASQLGKCNCGGIGLPTSTSTLEMILAVQGLLDPVPNTMQTDTVVVSLRNSTSPHELVESVPVVISSQCHGTASFTNAVNGVPYYIQINHRNSIETWSNTPQIFNGDSLTYDFTSSHSQAFGNNMVQVGSKWCIFSGDVNQDHTIDAGDVSIVDNASAIGLSGNVPEDLNGDGFVDASDLSIVDENAYNVISAVTP